MRLLILACSATKRHDPGLLPAIERYDGPSYRTLRRYLAGDPARRDALDLLVLSAEFGLIRGERLIPTYDHRMDTQRAISLRPSVASTLHSQLAERVYEATFVSLGADYLPALRLPEELRPKLGALTFASGGIGARLGQLRHWLLAGA